MALCSNDFCAVLSSSLTVVVQSFFCKSFFFSVADSNLISHRKITLKSSWISLFEPNILQNTVSILKVYYTRLSAAITTVFDIQFTSIFNGTTGDGDYLPRHILYLIFWVREAKLTKIFGLFILQCSAKTFLQENIVT